MPFRVTLNTNVPTKFEIVPVGTTSVNPNIVVVNSNLMPTDFGMNFHTYIYSGGLFVRNAGVTINNRVLVNPVFSHEKAGVIAANTPAQ